MKNLVIQGLKFIGFSGVGWLIDTIIYIILTSVLRLNIDIANIISSLVGVSFVFIMSTRKVFEVGSKVNIKLKYIIYIVYQLILIFTVSRVMIILKDYLISFDIKLIIRYISIIVKVLITPFTIVINFIVMKYLIEKI